MSQIHRPALPALPGLVKVFLIFSYGWAISLVLAALGLTGIYFFDRYILDSEALLWAVILIAVALCAVFAIISIHTRNTSAPDVCRVLCILLIALYALLAVRILAPAIGGGGRFRFFAAWRLQGTCARFSYCLLQRDGVRPAYSSHFYSFFCRAFFFL